MVPLNKFQCLNLLDRGSPLGGSFPFMADILSRVTALRSIPDLSQRREWDMLPARPWERRPRYHLLFLLPLQTQPQSKML